MARILKRKLPCFITLYLVVAVTGAFAFSAAEALHFYFFQKMNTDNGCEKTGGAL